MGVKVYDLEERTFLFAEAVRSFVRSSVKNLVNMDDFKQLIRSSGSVGANFIESVESISKKDRIYRIKICRKEAKESKFWLKLINSKDDELLLTKKNGLIQEANELMNIFGAIIRKYEKENRPS